MNAVAEINLLHANLSPKYVSYSRSKIFARLVQTRGFMICLLSAFAAYHSNANPINGPAAGAADAVKAEHARAETWLEKGAHKLNLDSQGVILKGYDPVAYFTQKKAIKGTPKYKANYHGATYYFSSSANLATFERNPSKYAPQYGGFCADGMKNRHADDIDPTVFFIIKGKLYVCASPEAEKEFRSNEQENIKKADQNWDEEYRWFY
ncbi:MAG: YHS domain-containing protein [Verrucomicrobia bacterium]|nr:YHS domain-containing protein [Verrucomicrobiota bacterium]